VQGKLKSLLIKFEFALQFVPFKKITLKVNFKVLLEWNVEAGVKKVTEICLVNITFAFRVYIRKGKTSKK